nr:hypothetical protein RNT25_03979 [arsenite-oxidising bacterium NT-25]
MGSALAAESALAPGEVEGGKAMVQYNDAGRTSFKAKTAGRTDVGSGTKETGRNHLALGGAAPAQKVTS